jgi:hypothetical protein
MYAATAASAFQPTSTAAEGPTMADARARLEAFAPPPGAQRIASPPTYVTAPAGGQIDGGPNWISVNDYWFDPESPEAVDAYIAGYTPPEARLLFTSGASTRGVITNWVSAYRWPEIPAVATARTLEVAFAPVASGGTIITAEAQAVWLEARLASSYIPAAAKFVEVTETREGKVRRASTSRPRQVDPIKRLIDGLAISQPHGIVHGGPKMESDPTRIESIFRRAAGTPALAKLSQDLPPNVGGEVSLTIRGVAQRNLTGGDALARRLRLLLVPQS